MNKQVIRKSAAYRSLLEAYVLTPVGEEQVAEVTDYLIFQDSEWKAEAAGSKLVTATPDGDWQANLLLIHPDDPFSFQRVDLKRCRTERLADIVASYAGRVRCDDGSGACRRVAEEEFGLCAN